MTEPMSDDLLEALKAQCDKPGRVFFFRAHARALVDEVERLREHLSLATEFRIPCTNQRGGYAEVTVALSPGRDLWAVTDGSFTGMRVWTDDGWQRLCDVGRKAGYRHTREEAIALGRRVAEIEGACIEAEFDALIAARGDGGNRD